MRAGLFTLAVTLIGAGALLLYQNLSGAAVWARAWPFWPLVLLLLGLEFLWHARRNPRTRVHRGAVVWLIVLLVLGGALNGALSFAGSLPWTWDWDTGPQYGEATVLELRETVQQAADMRKLDIQAVTGDIRATGSADGDVSVLAEVRVRGSSEAEAAANAREVKLDVRREGDRLVVRIDAPTRLRALVSADFTVTAPRTLEVTARSVSGDLDISGFGGDIVADVVSGSATVTACSGDVSLKSVSGEAEAVGIEGRTTVDLVSGDAVIRDVTGPVNIRTISGEALITLPQALAVDVHTVSGDVEILVPPDAGLDVSLSSTSGDIDTDLPLAVEKLNPGRRVDGAINGGGPGVSVSTTSGDIELRVGT